MMLDMRTKNNREFRETPAGKGLLRLCRPAAAALLSCALLTACGQKSDEADYIGIPAAKEAALDAAGISGGSASFTAAGLDKRNGTFYYQVDFDADGKHYAYAIDAVTGVVIEETVSGASGAQGAEGTDTPAAETSQDSPEGSASQGESSAEGGSFSGGTTAADGNSSNAETSGSAPKASGVAGDLSAPDASGVTGVPGVSDASGVTGASSPLQIALTHAGLSESDIYDTEVESDQDHDRHIFKVEFTDKNGIDYEYKIDAADGSIISFDQDADSDLLSQAGNQAGIISEDQARQLAADRVPGAAAADISVRLREDDGRQEYKGRLFYDGMRYEFKIDAYSGTFLEWEAERQNAQ